MSSAIATATVATSARTSRSDWVDIVKGITISLVVLWHSLTLNSTSVLFSPSLVAFNESLLLLRMPLFFFVAGFFIEKSLTLPWRLFLDRKILPFVWLYLLWSVLRPMSTGLPVALLQGRLPDFSPIVTMLWSPAATIWFIYALIVVFLLCRLLARFPRWAVFIAAFGVYCVLMSDGQHRGQHFLERTFELLPFFLLGKMAFGPISQFAPKVRLWHLSLLAIHLAVAPVVLSSSMAGVGPVLFVVSLIGIAGGMAAAILLSRSAVAPLATYIGRHSLEIYLLHYWPVFLLKYLLGREAYLPAFWAVLLIWTVGILFPLVSSHLARYLGLKWLFASPGWWRLPGRANKSDLQRCPTS